MAPPAKELQPSKAPIASWIEEAKEDPLFRQFWDSDPSFRAFGAAAISLRGSLGSAPEERKAIFNDVATQPRAELLSKLAGTEIQPGALKVIYKAEFESFAETDWRALLKGAADITLHQELRKLDRISPVLAQQLEDIPVPIRWASILEVVNQLRVSKIHWRELAQELCDAPANVRDSWREWSKTVNSIGSFWDFFIGCIQPTWKPFPLPESFFASPLLQPIITAKELRSEGITMRNCLAGRVRRARSGREAYFHWSGPTPASVQLVYSNEGWKIGQIKAAENGAVNQEESQKIRQVAMELIRNAPPRREAPDASENIIESLSDYGQTTFGAANVNRLAGELQTIRGKSLASTNGSYCIIEVQTGYVQFMADIGGREEILCEIQSHHFAPEMEPLLTDSLVSLILGCGFDWPDGEQNFARWFFVRSDDDVRRLAALALGLLEQCFCSGSSTDFTVKTHIAE